MDKTKKTSKKHCRDKKKSKVNSKCNTTHESSDYELFLASLLTFNLLGVKETILSLCNGLAAYLNMSSFITCGTFFIYMGSCLGNIITYFDNLLQFMLNFFRDIVQTKLKNKKYHMYGELHKFCKNTDTSFEIILKQQTPLICPESINIGNCKYINGDIDLYILYKSYINSCLTVTQKETHKYKYTHNCNNPCEGDIPLELVDFDSSECYKSHSSSNDDQSIPSDQGCSSKSSSSGLSGSKLSETTKSVSTSDTVSTATTFDEHQGQGGGRSDSSSRFGHTSSSDLSGSKFSDTTKSVSTSDTISTATNQGSDSSSKSSSSGLSGSKFSDTTKSVSTSDTISTATDQGGDSSSLYGSKMTDTKSDSTSETTCTVSTFNEHQGGRPRRSDSSSLSGSKMTDTTDNTSVTISTASTQGGNDSCTENTLDLGGTIFAEAYMSGSSLTKTSSTKSSTSTKHGSISTASQSDGCSTLQRVLKDTKLYIRKDRNLIKFVIKGEISGNLTTASAIKNAKNNYHDLIKTCGVINIQCVNV
jgi:hypothetical protein